MKNFKMYCKKGIDKNGCVDDEMISLFFEVDGEIVDSCEEDNIDNILIESYEMFKRNCEKYCFDGRFDKLEIDLKYNW
jgi:hypothetical protein